MKTQKQQLLDYLAIHASEAELLELCRKIKDNRVAVEFFLKDVVTTEAKEVEEDLTELESIQEDDEFRVLGRLCTLPVRTEIIALSSHLSQNDARDALKRLALKGKARYVYPGRWSL